MAESVDLVISVDAKLASEVATALRQSGVEVKDVLADIGTITARCRDDQIAAISHINGVVRVERERPVEIGPPGSPVQ
jgi:hypothetical protein